MGNQEAKEAQAGEVNCKPGWRRLVIINGAARTGKDTFIELMGEAALRRELDVEVRSRSSIDPVRNMLSMAGVDVSKKTEEDRRLLAVLGTELEAHSNFRSRHIISGLVEWPDQGVGRLMMAHVRELSTIATVKSMALAVGWPVTTLLVTRPGYDPIQSNPSDANVHSMSYDLHVRNDGDETGLANLADMYLSLLLSYEVSQ